MRLNITQSRRNYFVYLNDNPTPILSGAWGAKWFKRNCKLFDQNENLRLEITSSFRIDFWNMKYTIIIPTLELNSFLKPIKIF